MRCLLGFVKAFSNCSLFLFRLLQLKAPLVFDALMLHKEIPSSLKKLMDALINKSMAPFKGKCHELPVSSVESPNGYFPCLPIKCVRGNYLSDGKSALYDYTNCKKPSARNTHKTLTPGLFIINCQHGKFFFISMSKHFGHMIILCTAKRH